MEIFIIYANIYIENRLFLIQKITQKKKTFTDEEFSFFLLHS